MDEPDLNAMLADAKQEKHFRIGFSFPGDPHRDRVATLVKLLRSHEPGIRLFYDKQHEADITGKKLKPLFQTIYRDLCDFVVVIVCPAYFKSRYCQWEWKIIKKRLKKQREFVYLVRFNAEDNGIPEKDLAILKQYGLRSYDRNDDLVELAAEIYRQLHRRCPLTADETDANYRDHLRSQIASLLAGEGGRPIREAIDQRKGDFDALPRNHRALPALDLLFQSELIHAIALLQEAVETCLADTVGNTRKRIGKTAIDLFGRLVLLAVAPAWIAGRAGNPGICVTTGLGTSAGMAVLVARLDDTRAEFQVIGASVYGARQLLDEGLSVGEAGWLPKDNRQDMACQIAEIVFKGKVDGLAYESLCDKINARMRYDRLRKRDVYVPVSVEKHLSEEKRNEFIALENDLKETRFIYFGASDQAEVFVLDEAMLETAAHSFLQMIEAYST